MEFIIIVFAIPILALIYLNSLPEETCRNCKGHHGNYIDRVYNSDLGEDYSKKNGFLFHSKSCYKQFWREHMICETCKKVRNYQYSVNFNSLGESFFFCTNDCKKKFSDIRSEVWERDNGVCSKCQSDHNIHFDYLINQKNEGKNNFDNLQLLCQECYLEKNEDF